MLALKITLSQKLSQLFLIQLTACWLLTHLLATSTVFGDEASQFTTEQKSNIFESSIEESAVFQLKVEEKNQLERLKIDYQGLLSSDLSALEWLGIFANSEAERKHYARLLAARQIAVFNAISKFESEYIRALNALANNRKAKEKLNQHLILVTPFSCEANACQENIDRSLEHLNIGGRLDIYLLGTTKNADLRLWSVLNQIPLKKIQSNQVTISHATSRFYQLKSGVYSLD